MTGILNTMEGKTIRFGLSDLVLMTETLGGKPLPEYTLMAVGPEYRIWVTELDRARNSRVGPQGTGNQDDVRAQDLEKQKARAVLRSLQQDETQYHSALGHLEDLDITLEVPRKIESEVGALFHPIPDAGASLKHALEGQARAGAGGGGRLGGDPGFQPKTMSTPFPGGNGGRGPAGRGPAGRVTIEEQEAERQNVKQLVAQLGSQTPGRGKVERHRRDLRGDLDSQKVLDLWEEEKAKKKDEMSGIPGYLWKQSGKNQPPVRDQVKTMANHFRQQ